MKKIYLLFTTLVATVAITNAQVTVEIDPANDAYLGYANVFETPANGGGFVFGQAWGVPDLKTVVDTGAGTVTLQPNFNTWDPADPFWVTPAGEANKVFEGSTYVEDNSLVGSEVTFTGGCAAYTLDPSYAVKAFIKVFNSDFTVLKEVNTLMVAGQNFSVTYTDVEPEDTFVQYGFAVTGLIADPADEATLGSVVVTQTFLGVDDINNINVAVYPNPVTDVLNVQTQNEISEVAIYNMLGQLVHTHAANSNKIAVDLSSLQAGLYIANVQTTEGSKSIRLVKE